MVGPSTDALNGLGDRDTDFADLALHLRRRGIRIELASVAQTLGAGLKTSANGIIDPAKLLTTFQPPAWPLQTRQGAAAREGPRCKVR
jgi:hypothetical protein